jgi:hypothetical protein
MGRDRTTNDAWPLDVVVLRQDLPAHGLRQGDLGAVVEVYCAAAVGVEFVAAPGRLKRS